MSVVRGESSRGYIGLSLQPTLMRRTMTGAKDASIPRRTYVTDGFHEGQLAPPYLSTINESTSEELSRVGKR
jgi:hypothetical protein